jgi:hypothetical protein
MPPEPSKPDDARRSAVESDALLEEAERLKRSVEALERTRRRAEKHSTGGRAARTVAGTHETLLQGTAGVRWLYTRIVRPVATHPWAGAPFRWYGRLWRKLVYRVDADGDRLFGPRRAGTMLLATAAALWRAPAVLGSAAELVGDATWKAFSYRSGETWYLGKSQEIDPEGNVFSAQGCASVSCSDQTSIYFRIKPSVAHHVWSLVRNGNVFFPDFVAAGIQNDVNKCEVTTYGARWKLLVRNWDMYPQILSVDCVPLTEREIEAVQQALGAAGA